MADKKAATPPSVIGQYNANIPTFETTGPSAPSAEAPQPPASIFGAPGEGYVPELGGGAQPINQTVAQTAPRSMADYYSRGGMGDTFVKAYNSAKYQTDIDTKKKIFQNQLAEGIKGAKKYRESQLPMVYGEDVTYSVPPPEYFVDPKTGMFDGVKWYASATVGVEEYKKNKLKAEEDANTKANNENRLNLDANKAQVEALQKQQQIEQAGAAGSETARHNLATEAIEMQKSRTTNRSSEKNFAAQNLDQAKKNALDLSQARDSVQKEKDKIVAARNSVEYQLAQKMSISMGGKKGLTFKKPDGSIGNVDEVLEAGDVKSEKEADRRLSEYEKALKVAQNDVAHFREKAGISQPTEDVSSEPEVVSEKVKAMSAMAESEALGLGPDANLHVKSDPATGEYNVYDSNDRIQLGYGSGYVVPKIANSIKKTLASAGVTQTFAGGKIVDITPQIIERLLNSVNPQTKRKFSIEEIVGGLQMAYDQKIAGQQSSQMLANPGVSSAPQTIAAP